LSPSSVALGAAGGGVVVDRILMVLQQRSAKSDARLVELMFRRLILLFIPFSLSGRRSERFAIYVGCETMEYALLIPCGIPRDACWNFLVGEGLSGLIINLRGGISYFR